MILIYYFHEQKSKFMVLKSMVSKFMVPKSTTTKITSLESKIKINTYDDFLSKEDCQTLITTMESKLKPSTVVCKNGAVQDDNARTSYTAFFNRGENELIEKIENKVCDLLNLSKYQLEPIQISRYIEGQQYKYHYDYLDTKMNKIKNQRQHTVLIYLTNVPEKNGGCTKFYYDKAYQPIQGKMVQWCNLTDNDKPNKYSLHSGEPIKGNCEKYILTIWTRLNEFTKN